MKTLTIIVIMLALTLTANSQNNWVHQFNSSGAENEGAYNLVVDANGNIYVAGTTSYMGQRGILQKISPGGSVIWTRYVSGYNGGPVIHARALIDQYGFIYVSGIARGTTQTYDFLLSKYDINGNSHFSVTYGDPVYDELMGDAMVDNSGCIVAAVSCNTSAQVYKINLLRYSNTGVLLNNQSANIQAISLYARRILQDQNGNFFIGGQASSAQHGWQAFVMKYTSAFNYNSSYFVGDVNQPHYFGDAELILNNDVLITTSGFRSTNVTDLTVIKTNNFFSLMWRKDFNIAANKNETPLDMKVDNSNNIYVVGSAGNNYVSQDAFTVKLDINGNMQWSRIYDRGGMHDQARNVMADSYGNVFCAGVSTTQATQQDAMVLKYDINGNLQLVFNYNGAAFSADAFIGLRVEPNGMFTACGSVTNYSNNIANYDIIVSRLEGNLTGLSNLNQNIPDEFSLEQNYPNPFNPSTTIKFSIPASSNVKLAVFNSAGQEVASLLNEEMNAGTYEYRFDAAKLSSGVYFYKLITDGFSDTKKMILVK